MYTVKQRGGKLMKVKLNITSNLNEEKAEFWINADCKIKLNTL